MTTDTRRFRALQERAAHGKYRRLFMTLLVRRSGEWRTTIGEVESLLGFDLPPSARRHRQWWENNESHSQALAWIGAGWETSEVDVGAGTLVFTPGDSHPVDRSLFDLNVVLPVHHTKLLIKDWTFNREEIYEDRI